MLENKTWNCPICGKQISYATFMGSVARHWRAKHYEYLDNDYHSSHPKLKKEYSFESSKCQCPDKETHNQRILRESRYRGASRGTMQLCIRGAEI